MHVTSNHHRDDHSAKKSFRSECPFARKGEREGGRVGRQTDSRRGGRNGKKALWSRSCCEHLQLPPSLPHSPVSPSLLPCSPMFHPSIHPSWILFHGVKWRRAHLGNVLSIDWNEEEEGIGGSSRSKSWSFEFPPFPLSALSLVSPIAISQTRFPPPSLPPPPPTDGNPVYGGAVVVGISFLPRNFSGRPTDWLPSFTMAMERVSRRGADEVHA